MPISIKIIMPVERETVFKVTLPAAKSGIVTAVVLGIGRAIGEAMAVMMNCRKQSCSVGYIKRFSD